MFKVKRDAAGQVTRYKARLVAQGFRQIAGVNYNHTFAPVSKHNTLRTLLAAAAHHDMHILQMDITTAFLHGDLEEDIYIAQPKGYHQGDSTFSCKLHKSIYGLKQAGTQWN